MRQTRRAGLLNVKTRTFKCEGEWDDHMLHYEQVFGNVSERKESKCSAVLWLCCQCKNKFFVRDRLNVLMIKINFNLLKILTMNSLNVKDQGKSSNQLAFYLSAYTMQYFRGIKSTI